MIVLLMNVEMAYIAVYIARSHLGFKYEYQILWYREVSPSRYNGSFQK